MDIPATVQTEWHVHHTLGRQALRLIHELAAPGDTHPIATALDLLRAGETVADG